jgi:hypothetical protein
MSIWGSLFLNTQTANNKRSSHSQFWNNSLLLARKLDHVMAI